MKRSWGLLVLILACLVFTSGGRANAQKNPVLTIEPVLQTVVLGETDTTKSFKVRIANSTKSQVDFRLSIIDFGSLDETGGLVFAGSKGDRLISKYGLSKWMELDKTTLTLEPGKEAVVTAQILNKDSLSPGGHYGAVLAKATRSSPKISNSVNLDPTLSSLIFTTKAGGAKYDLGLSDIKHNGSLFRAPSKVTLRFNNPGNVHVVPRGIVKLVVSNNAVIAQGIINTESSYILPERHRQFPVGLKQMAPYPNSLINSARVVVDYRYDGLDKFASKTYEVSYVSKFLPLFLLALALLVYGTHRSKIYRKVPKKWLKLPKVR